MEIQNLAKFGRLNVEGFSLLQTALASELLNTMFFQLDCWLSNAVF